MSLICLVAVIESNRTPLTNHSVAKITFTIELLRLSCCDIIVVDNIVI